jgi:hypothetical protein
MKKNEMALVWGSFLAIVHAVWLVFVALIPQGLQSFVDWIFGLHGMTIGIAISGVTWSQAITLIVVTFIAGYIMGWVFGWLVKRIRR